MIHKDEILTGLIILAIIAVIGIIAFGLGSLDKTITWNMMYKDHAISLICEMVKPEHLVNPEQCK